MVVSFVCLFVCRGCREVNVIRGTVMEKNKTGASHLHRELPAGSNTTTALFSSPRLFPPSSLQPWMLFLRKAQLGRCRSCWVTPAAASSISTAAGGEEREHGGRSAVQSEFLQHTQWAKTKRRYCIYDCVCSAYVFIDLVLMFLLASWPCTDCLLNVTC